MFDWPQVTVHQLTLICKAKEAELTSFVSETHHMMLYGLFVGCKLS